MTRTSICIAALLGLLAVSPALAADRKPDATINTKAVEANVTLDAPIKADGPLAA